MSTTIKNELKIFSKLTKNEIVVLCFVVSTFISVFLQGALILLLPFYILFTRQWKLIFPRNKSSYLLLLFSIFAAISTFMFSGTGYLNGFVLETSYVKLLSIGIIILSFDIFFFSNIITRRVFVLSLKISALLSITSFFVAAVQKMLKIYPDPVNRPGRVASVFMNENYYGMVIEFILLIALFFLFRATDLKSKAFYSGVILINLAGLWLCQTRMAFIVIGFTVFLFLFLNARKLSYIILGILAALCVILLFYPAFLPRFDSISSYLDYRLGIWEVALNAFCETPIMGRGYYAYCHVWTLSADPHFSALHAHNLYIEVLLNFGIIGAILLGSFSAIQVYLCLKNCKRAKNPAEASLVLCLVVAILVHSLADTTLFWPQTGFFAILLLACPQMYLSENKESCP